MTILTNESIFMISEWPVIKNFFLAIRFSIRASAKGKRYRACLFSDSAKKKKYNLCNLCRDPLEVVACYQKLPLIVTTLIKPTDEN